MTLLQSKQVEKILTCYNRVDGFTTSAATSDVVTTPITTALTTAGNNGVAVPLQVSTDVFTIGVVTAGSNRVLIFDNTNKLPISDGNGDEVYGRITEAAGVYTLSYFVETAGVETAYAMVGADIDFEFAYRFDFVRFPADATIKVKSRNVGDDPASGGSGSSVEEIINISALNTFADLTFNPSSNVILYINGKGEDNLSGGAFTEVAKAITWSSGNAGYDAETTDRAVAVYSSLEA